MDIREQYGVRVRKVVGPFETHPAQRIGDGSDGGTLDRGIYARLEDGTRVVVGELWAMGPDEHGDRVSFDVDGLAAELVQALNGGSNDGA